MRSFFIAVTALMLFAGGAAQAKISITVDKNAQLMTVAVDGVERYQWPVSTGLPSYETPNGSFKTFRMEEDHYSKEFDDAPMPHSIFFTKVRSCHPRHQLGQPSRQPGFARLRAAVARPRLDAVCAGAKGRRAQRHRDADAGRRRSPWRAIRGPAPTPLSPAATPLRRRRNTTPPAIRSCWCRSRASRGRVVPQGEPQVQADDGYIYPADGSSNEARYPAPRSRRALRRAGLSAARSSTITTTAAMRGPTAPQGYLPAASSYYQPRGLFTYQD